MTTDSVALLIGKVEDLTAKVEALLERTPDTRLTWVSPQEFAAMVGKSTRTLQNWREDGIFRETSIKKIGNKWTFHRVDAMADVERSRG